MSGWKSIVNSRFMMILGAIVGLFLMLLTVGIVFWIEHYTLNTAHGLEAMASQTVSAPAETVNPANEGKLIHLSGQATTTDTITDPQFGIAVPALRLTREVEVRQWKENKTEKKQGNEKIITYDYEQIWSTKSPPSSSSFNKRAGHENPAGKPYDDAKYHAATVTLGAFTLIPGQIEKIPADEAFPITAEMLAKLPGDLKGQVKVTDDGILYVGANPDAPSVGDCRIRYKIAKPQVISVVARQQGSQLAPYPIEGGQSINLVERGSRSAAEMFASAQSSTAILGWGGRILGFGLMAMGLFLVLRPTAAAASGAPPESLGFNFRVGLFAIAGSLPAILGIVGLRWLFDSVVVGSILMGSSFVLLVLVALLSFNRSVGLRAGGQRWTPEEREYFRRIALDPKNQALRLEFAEKLEKKRNPLGEFIRLCHELDAIPEGDPRREERDKRWSELLGEHGAKWFQGLRQLQLEPRIAGTFFPTLWMTEGIIDQVTIDRPGILPEQANRLFEAAPGLRALEFNSARMDDGMNPVSYEPRVPAIVKLPRLEQIGVLKMSSMGLELSDLEAIASSPHLKNLTELDFSYNRVGPDGANALRHSPTLKKLQVLELRGCELGEAGAIHLALSANLGQLQKLNLGNNAVGPRGAATLAASPHLKRLETLLLDDNEIGPAATKNLAISAHLKSLVELNLSRNNIGPQGAQALATSPNLVKLARLNLNSNNLTGLGLRVLGASPHLGELTVLELESNEIDDAGVKGLTASRVITHLEELSLAYNNIGDEGFKALAAWAGLAHVRKLNLSSNKAGWAGVKALCASRHLTALQELDLGHLDIGLAGAQALAAAPLLRTLKYLWLHDVELTTDAVALLRERFGEALHTS